jgi:hypothetical protein
MVAPIDFTMQKLAMEPQEDEVPQTNSGLAGTMKLIGILAVLLLAALATLFVLDVLPREMLREATVKSVLVLGIVALASVVIGLLATGRRHD